MNKDEKSLLDELWDAVGLDRPNTEPPVAEPKTEEVPSAETIEESPREEKKEEPSAALKEETAQAEEAPSAPMDLVQEKKKDIRFLVIYTVAFVVVISFLIGGSYLITSRIHREMAESNENLNTSQSTLKNIQEENRSLKAQNQALQEENDRLNTSAAETDELMTSVGDMIEHGEYLSAAQDAYIRGNRTLARSILATVDRDKLSQPAKEYYDTLDDRLN